MAIKRALVCEDDAAIRSLVKAVVTREGFAVDVATDGHEALARLEENSYDILILDLMMPNLDGYGVIRSLREKQPSFLKRVIVMTAASNALREEFPERICTLLPKPFDISQLTETLRGCMRSCEDENPAGPE